MLTAALGNGLGRLVIHRTEHRTPGGAVQPFTYLGLRHPRPLTRSRPP